MSIEVIRMSLSAINNELLTRDCCIQLEAVELVPR